MFTILKNGKISGNDETKTFGDVLNENAVGKTFLVEANGKKFKVLKYWKSQKTFADKPEQTTKGEPTGNKTTFVVKWTGEKEETYTNDSFRKQFCPEYSTKTYERDKDKTKEFKPAQNLELATLAELAEALKAIQEEQKRREDARQKQIADLEAQLAALRA